MGENRTGHRTAVCFEVAYIFSVVVIGVESCPCSWDCFVVTESLWPFLSILQRPHGRNTSELPLWPLVHLHSRFVGMGTRGSHGRTRRYALVSGRDH